MCPVHFLNSSLLPHVESVTRGLWARQLAHSKPNDSCLWLKTEPVGSRFSCILVCLENALLCCFLKLETVTTGNEMGSLHLMLYLSWRSRTGLCSWQISSSVLISRDWYLLGTADFIDWRRILHEFRQVGRFVLMSSLLQTNNAKILV